MTVSGTRGPLSARAASLVIAGRGLSVAFAVLASTVVCHAQASPPFTPPPAPVLSKDGKQLRDLLQSQLANGWQMAAFSATTKDYQPWSSMFPAIKSGYSAYFQRPAQQVAEAGSKNGGQSLTHPKFQFWILAGTNPAKFAPMLAAAINSPVQQARPFAIGYNKQFVVTCLYNCTNNPQVAALAAALKLEPMPQ